MQTYRYEVFTSVIEHKIKNGTLLPGSRLPSIREIKKEYRLSMSSVQSGYEYLVIKGWVKNIPRSGYFVASDLKKATTAQSSPQKQQIKEETTFSKNVKLTSVRNRPNEYGSFNAATPTDLLIPQKLILKKMQEVIREKAASLLRYYPVNGSLKLRELIASRARQYGCALNSEELIITDGALQALYIALASVTRPGDTIAVESPCVFSILEVIANLQLKTIEIPIHEEIGFDTAYFRKICNENDIKALVVTPNFHNPTGILMTDEIKKELLSVALMYEIPIIENDIYGDLYFGEERPSCIRNFDESGLVMTFSSFSKTLAPGIRLGWLHPGKYYVEAEKLRFSLGRSVAPIYQELLIKLLEENSYEKHLRVFRKQLQEQATAIGEALSNYFPDGSHFYKPAGGYSIWGRLPERLDIYAFYHYCETHRILFTPGEIFGFGNQFSHYFRIIFADRINTKNVLSLQKAGEKARKLLPE
ncbi:GntR family transcriptional regulator [Chryseobacterium piperi]|uniref:GntR family transcriptional regulator n=2 Tax=Chryseobacterium piperi TaxID=558152 RepID=A0A086BJB5_9FLAO|nr:PLP-dependent aminotransferase family protein [Chryseobacterium piperi]KFF29029.1 GntR family transcriptional regulator [Chryseobacterium piperi]